MQTKERVSYPVDRYAKLTLDEMKYVSLGRDSTAVDWSAVGTLVLGCIRVMGDYGRLDLHHPNARLVIGKLENERAFRAKAAAIEARVLALRAPKASLKTPFEAGLEWIPNSLREAMNAPSFGRWIGPMGPTLPVDVAYGPRRCSYCRRDVSKEHALVLGELIHCSTCALSRGIRRPEDSREVAGWTRFNGFTPTMWGLVRHTCYDCGNLLERRDAFNVRGYAYCASCASRC